MTDRKSSLKLETPNNWRKFHDWDERKAWKHKLQLVMHFILIQRKIVIMLLKVNWPVWSFSSLSFERNFHFVCIYASRINCSSFVITWSTQRLIATKIYARLHLRLSEKDAHRAGRERQMRLVRFNLREVWVKVFRKKLVKVKKTHMRNECLSQRTQVLDFLAWANKGDENFWDFRDRSQVFGSVLRWNELQKTGNKTSRKDDKLFHCHFSKIVLTSFCTNTRLCSTIVSCRCFVVAFFLKRLLNDRQIFTVRVLVGFMGYCFTRPVELCQN